MATRKEGSVLRQLNTLFCLGVLRELTDGQLLERFATGRGQAAELAFAALVERHGAMVLRVCRSQLTNAQDTQDAFQATFLVLIEKARTLWVRDSLGPWLHQVALRTAACARLEAARRRKHERRAAELASCPDGQVRGGDAPWERERALHAEIDRLPERYRTVIVLCDLERHTCEEAARRLGRPVGTVKCWRARGRELLRTRLARSGLAPATGLGAMLAADATAGTAVSTAAVGLVHFAAGMSAAGAIPASVRKLVKGVLKMMTLSALRTTAGLVLVLTILAAGLGVAVRVAAEDSRVAVAEQKSGGAAQTAGKPPRTAGEPRVNQPAASAGNVWSMSLREAIRIGLDHSEACHVVGFVNPFHPDDITVEPRGAGLDDEPFRVEVMALVRSIEQQYWSLAQQHAQLWSSERAVEVAEGILKRERSELEVGRGTVADVAEGQQRLEQFKLELVTKTSDVVTTERQLRNILGLPLIDKRRILPATAPVEERREPDWETCKSVMLRNNPLIRAARADVEKGERSQIAAEAQARLQSDLRQVVHQKSNDLARYFLEIEADYKQYEAASRIRMAAAQRVDAQRAFYEEGRITIDRYFDAVHQHAIAAAQEAQFKTTYNIALVALEEAKGTLLEHERIGVAHTAGPVITGSIDFPPATPPRPGTSRPPSEPAPSAAKAGSRPEVTEAPPGQTAGAGKTYTFQITIGIGPRPIEIRGSVTVAPARTPTSGEEAGVEARPRLHGRKS